MSAKQPSQEIDPNLLPSDPEREAIVLGKCLRAPEGFADARAAIVAPSVFHDLRNRLLWEAMDAIGNEGGAPDLIATHRQATTAKAFNAVFGDATNAAAYLRSIQQPNSENVPYHVAILVKLWEAREAIRATDRLRTAIAQSPDDIAEHIHALRTTLDELSRTAEGDGWVSALEAAQGAGDIIDRESEGTATGVRALDPFFRFNPGRLIILAGRPGRGKTAMAATMAMSMMRTHRKRVLWFGYEMPPEEMAARFACGVSSVPFDRFERGQLSHSEKDTMRKGLSQVLALPIDFARFAYDANKIERMIAKRISDTKDVGLVVIDYLQLIPVKAGFNAAEKSAAFGEVATILKRSIALNCRVPVLMLSQLTREADKADEPTMSLLAQSARLEEAADTVVMLWGKDTQDGYDSISANIVKNRGGALAKGLALRLDHQSLMFTEAEVPF